MAATITFGNQQPTYKWSPDYESTSGPEAYEFARSVGLTLDPWQRWVLNDALAELPGSSRWANNEVGVIVGRQNGKGSIIEARELAGLFVFGEKFIMHSAHEFKTAGDAFRRMTTIVEMCPDLDRRVVAVARSKGQEGITFKVDGRRVRLNYFARSSGSGRGFTGTDCVILDEAMILDDGPIAAMLPTMAAAPNWQVFYTASAGDRRLRTESRVLGRIRRRGYRQEPGLVFYEWAAHLTHQPDCPDGCTLDDPKSVATLAKTNPTMNIERLDGSHGIRQDFLEQMRRSMAEWDFNREFLGVGDYPSDDGWNLFSEEQWSGLFDPFAIDAGAPRPFTVGIESTWDRSSTAISIASVRPDGKWHWELIHVAAGTSWVLDFCRALRAKKPVAFTIDPKGPSATLIDDLENARLKVHKVTLAQYASACARMLSIITETGEAIHLGQDTLKSAAERIEKRDLGGGQFAWQRDNTTGDVSPFLSLTMAVVGHVALGRSGKRRPMVGVA